MQRVEFEADLRSAVGKGVARQLRMKGLVPGVIYRAGSSTLLSLELKAARRVARALSGALLSVKISGEETARVSILREVQRDPISREVLHIDLFEVSLTEPIRVRVALEIIGGVPVGVKDGGSLQHHLRDLEIRCLPGLIPDQISVDASSLKMGEGIHVREIPLDAGIEVLSDLNQAVVSVIAPITDAKLEALLATGPKEAKEPEVLTKKEPKEAVADGKEGKPEAKGKEVKK